MKHGSNTSSTPPGPRKEHQRTKDLNALVRLLNVWAMAPAMDDRNKALRDALRGYKEAVSAKEYPSIRKDFCAATEACNEPPTGSFEAYFGDSGEDSNKLPWED